ncbi:hypothetical protein D3C81_2144140 [compost metagenome]
MRQYELGIPVPAGFTSGSKVVGASQIAHVLRAEDLPQNMGGNISDQFCTGGGTKLVCHHIERIALGR